MKTSIYSNVTLALVGSSILALAGNWSQFRGPNGSGISDETNLPDVWSETKNLSWKAPLPGPGSSSPVVFNDRVYITSYSGYADANNDPGTIENLKRHLLCLDAKSGQVLWRTDVKAAMPEDPYRGYITEHGYASNTPAVDESGIYCFFGKTGAVAFDHNGRLRWTVNLGKESSNRRWGSASSPILYKDTVIINASDESQSIRALQKADGKERWKAEAAGLELTYGGPQIVKNDQGLDELLISAPQEVWALNPSTGKLNWYVETGLPGNICPSLTVHGSTIYTFGGYPRTGTVAMRAGGKGDMTEKNILWESDNTSYVPSAIYDSGRLHWISDKGEAYCVDARNGDLIYKERLDGLETGGRNRSFYGSAVLADGKIYAPSRKNGVYVFAAGSHFKVVAQNRFEGDKSDFNASPAISNGRLYFRSNKALYCITQP